MARQVPSGTPERPTRYLTPARRSRLVTASLIVPFVMLIGVLAYYKTGHRTVASPAPLVLEHARFETSCQECHAPTFPARVASTQCERCHDPRATGRLQVDAHATWIPTPHQVASKTATFTCSSCHVDHRGRLAPLAVAETRDCASCHTFRTLGDHPASTRDPAASAARGLRFSHPAHIDEARRKLGGGCDTCHRPTADLSRFEPVSFDRLCSTCHLESGVLRAAMTDPVAAGRVTTPPSGFAGRYAVRRPGRDQVVVSGLIHRDPWILENMRQLNRGFDTTADVQEQTTLQTRISALERARTAGTSRHVIEGVQPPSLGATLLADRALDSALAAARARLGIVSARVVDRAAPPTTGQERAQRRDDVQSLTVACVTCHTLRDGREIAPIDLTSRRLTHARFTHAPHISQVSCETCHSRETDTAKSEPVIPGIETCRQCHATGRAPFACGVCHGYHPSADVAFGRSGFTLNR